MDSAVRLLDHVVHCLDESRWPFSIEEILSTLGLCGDSCWLDSSINLSVPAEQTSRTCANMHDAPLGRNRIEFTASMLLGICWPNCRNFSQIV